MDALSLKRIVAGIGLVDVDDLVDDVSFFDQGALDSLGLVELQFCLEEWLGREIGPDELSGSTLLTVNGILGWLATIVRA